MCGIIFEVRAREHGILNDEDLLQRISNRGPDCVNMVEISIGDGVTATFCGAVLWMQGSHMTPQPVVNDQGILLYNGDIYDETCDQSVCDTHLIMDKLGRCKDGQDIVSELSSLKGPFSLIYFSKNSNILYFTRDKIGRNSLLFYKTEHSMVISSVLGRNYKCVEIPTTYVHVWNLKTNKIILVPWIDECQRTEEYYMEDWLTNLKQKQNLSDEEFVIECKNSITQSDKEGIIKYIEKIASETNSKLTLMTRLLEHETIKNTVLKLTELLENSVKIRLKTQPQKCKECLLKENICNHSTIGILFSGGLDCTILSFLADKYLDENQSIDLLNVAFKKGISGSYDVPDRLTGMESFKELKKLCPKRKWIFKEINVPKEELEFYQKSTIADLVFPRQTILDESLGSALWFAARGQDESSTSACRVLLLGSGADELFGGYSRHRNAFKHHSWAGLAKELELDWKRISFRNLARDNRVICDHGRQPRLPYLDENLTKFVLELQPWLKCFPIESLGQGVGDKLMLRLTALHLGLSDVVTFPKRALQFGSKIANKKQKGSDLSKTFLSLEIND